MPSDAKASNNHTSVSAVKESDKIKGSPEAARKHRGNHRDGKRLEDEDEDKVLPNRRARTEVTAEKKKVAYVLAALQGARRHAEVQAGAADAEYRDCSCRSAERQAQWLAKKYTICAMQAVLPNPSLKRSANGRPPSPGRWYSVHCHRPGLGGLPSSPA